MGVTLYELEAWVLLYTNVEIRGGTLYVCEAWALLYTNVKHGRYFIRM